MRNQKDWGSFQSLNPEDQFDDQADWNSKLSLHAFMSWLFITPSGLEMCFSEGAGKHMEGIKNKFIRSSWSGKCIKRNSALHQMSKWMTTNTNQLILTCHFLFTCWCQVRKKVASQPHWLPSTVANAPPTFRPKADGRSDRGERAPGGSPADSLALPHRHTWWHQPFLTTGGAGKLHLSQIDNRKHLNGNFS